MAFSSCGEFVEFEEEKEDATKLTLARHNLDLMVGDKFVLPVKLTPDTLPNMSVYWATADKTIVEMRTDTMVAVAVGKAKVMVTAVSGLASDTCQVTVYPLWQLSSRYAPYETMLYAQVTVDNAPMSSDMTVAAFCGEELRGVGKLTTGAGKTYLAIRIYSETAEHDVIGFRCYDPKRALVSVAKEELTFDGETHGTLSQLFTLTFD